MPIPLLMKPIGLPVEYLASFNVDDVSSFYFNGRCFLMIQYFTTFVMVVFQQQKKRCGGELCVISIFAFSLCNICTTSIGSCLSHLFIQVYDAARRAAIHDTIMNFPAKYSTVVGERGLKVRIILL